MATMVRFKPVEIDSKIFFAGKIKKALPYQVKSLSLVPVTGVPVRIKIPVIVPEIFWQ